jgi:hypothetical protein
MRLARRSTLLALLGVLLAGAPAWAHAPRPVAVAPSPSVGEIARAARTFAAETPAAEALALDTRAAETAAVDVPTAEGRAAETPAAAPLPEKPAGNLPLPALVALAALLVGGGLLARRHRVALPVALAVLLAHLAFESALHSVHHLMDPAGAAECQLASGAAQADTAGGEGSTSRAPVLATEPRWAPPDQSLDVLRPPRPDEGRGPPA